MKVYWVREKAKLGFNRPQTWFVLGVRGSGKSSLLEYLAECYLTEGHAVLDLFGSRDGESLGWLRSPGVEDKKILIIHGDNVSLNCSHQAKNVSKVSKSDLDKYDILVSSSPLYSSPNDEFNQVNRLIDLLYKRTSWRRLIYVVTREAANLYYSRLRVSRNQLAAKAEATYLIREARHMGVALGLDTLKYTSIDVDIRVVLDYLCLKSQGALGLPYELKWLYSFFKDHVLRSMPPQYFFMVLREGPLAFCEFPEVSWHKKEKKDILKAVGFKATYGDEIDYGEYKGSFTTVGDIEHLEIIELQSQGLSYGEIAKKLGRSKATIHGQIHSHNREVKEAGSARDA